MRLTLTVHAYIDAHSGIYIVIFMQLDLTNNFISTQCQITKLNYLTTVRLDEWMTFETKAKNGSRKYNHVNGANVKK